MLGLFIELWWGLPEKRSAIDEGYGRFLDLAGRRGRGTSISGRRKAWTERNRFWYAQFLILRQHVDESLDLCPLLDLELYRLPSTNWTFGVLFMLECESVNRVVAHVLPQGRCSSVT